MTYPPSFDNYPYPPVPPQRRRMSTPVIVTIAVGATLIVLLAILIGVGVFLLGVPHVDPDQEFLSDVHSSVPSASAISDKTLIGLAKSSCEALKAGSSTSDIASAIQSTMGSNASQITIAKVIGVGIRHYCPEEEGK